MKNNVYKIYFTSNNHANSANFSSLNYALDYAQTLRNDEFNRFSFITMVSENIELVGQQGVDSVVDGKLPSGEDYTYTKNDALSQRSKKPPTLPAGNVGTDDVEVRMDDE